MSADEKEQNIAAALGQLCDQLQSKPNIRTYLIKIHGINHLHLPAFSLSLRIQHGCGCVEGIIPYMDVLQQFAPPRYSPELLCAVLKTINVLIEGGAGTDSFVLFTPPPPPAVFVC